ncbi:MAG: hypothetical protein AAF384_05995 [Pseudomonadota bacterium]
MTVEYQSFAATLKSPHQGVLLSWISKLCGNEVKKQALAHPCVINGVQTLVYERGMESDDPIAFYHLIKYAEANNFEIQEDRRADFLSGVRRVQDKRKANVVSVMALAASLLAGPSFAESPTPEPGYSFSKTYQPHHHHDVGEQFTYHSDTQLTGDLLRWLNDNSQFQHNIDDVPGVKRVSSLQMAKLAFGEDLPKAVDPEKMRIFGLYNFNERAVYLLDSLDLNSAQGKGVLLHELVHFLQYQYDEDENAQCMAELEGLAYLLEAQYLTAHDHEHKISMNHIRKVSRCT